MSFRRFSGQPHPVRGNFNQGRRPRGVFSDINKFINRTTEISVEEDYIPTNQFIDFAFTPEVKANIVSRKYIIPTPIQDQTIHQALEGRDVLGIANTGTGKTAAFLLPLINKVFLDRSEMVLILAPTRELAVQIEDEFKAFSRGMGMFSVLCIGGASMNVQIHNLRRRYNFVIATPGRLKDLVNQRVVNLGRFNSVVLDEVDQMFDMGFVKDIQLLLGQLPRERQSLFFSATISREIDSLVKSEMINPVVVSLKKRDTASTVDQDVVRIKPGDSKIEILHDLLVKEDFTKVLIFGRTKRGVNKLSDMLHERGFRVDSIHGDKTQNARQMALTKFKKDHIVILVATDVAARGIDIPDVSHVINYELPETYEDYIHRIGRTGRANKLGKALTFVE
ncbi:MAG: DEAD/DEAH box helicase [bacterium]|nr:DEAD/DEAH box helicase [bacterium]